MNISTYFVDIRGKQVLLSNEKPEIIAARAKLQRSGSIKMFIGL